MVRDVLRSLLRLGGSATIGLMVLAAGCAYEPQGFDALDGRRRLSDLSLSESRLVCDWVDEQASARPPPSSSSALRCARNERAYSYLDFADRCPDPRETQCPTTLLQVRRCIPAVLAAMADQPCAFMKVDSLAALDEIVKQIPACRGVARCAYHPPGDDDEGDEDPAQDEVPVQ